MDGVMHHTEDRISDEMAEQILAVATRLYREASRLEQAAERSAQAGFSHGELQRACIEAEIPTQYFDQAFLIIEEDRSRLEQQKLQHQQKWIDRRKKVRQLTQQTLNRSTDLVLNTIINAGPKAIGSVIAIYWLMGVGDYLKIQGAGLKEIANKNTEIVRLKETLGQRDKEIAQQVQMNASHENEQKIHRESKDRHQAQVKVLNDKITQLESELAISKEEAIRLRDLNLKRINSETKPKTTTEEASSAMLRWDFRSLVRNKTGEEVKAAIGHPAEIKIQAGIFYWTYYRKTMMYSQSIDPKVTVKLSDDRVIEVEFD
jgi:hypothetical protein